MLGDGAAIIGVGGRGLGGRGEEEGLARGEGDSWEGQDRKAKRREGKDREVRDVGTERA